MTRVTLSEARDNLSDLINRVKYSNEKVIVNKHGKDTVAIISITDLQLLDALIEKYEHELDIKEVERVLSQENRDDYLPWEEVKCKLGLEK